LGKKHIAPLLRGGFMGCKQKPLRTALDMQYLCQTYAHKATRRAGAGKNVKNSGGNCAALRYI
jgi:hypothetical protein